MRKNIDLSKEAVRELTVLAATIDTNFKNFVEEHLEKLAKAEQKSQTPGKKRKQGNNPKKKLKP